MTTNKNFELMNDRDLFNTNGGLLGGALAGWILGGTVGLIGATAVGVVTGELTLSTIGKAYTTGALVGAAIGTATPV